MCGKFRGQFSLEDADAVRGIGRNQSVERRGGALEELPGTFHGQHGVFESCRFRIAYDCPDLSQVPGKACTDCLGIVGLFDFGKRGQPEWQRAGAQEGVGHEATLSCNRAVLNGDYSGFRDGPP
ncbi:hypothetical protein D9M72_386760 [compost metagenome]